jgi:hypothetical protein
VAQDLLQGEAQRVHLARGVVQAVALSLVAQSHEPLHAHPHLLHQLPPVDRIVFGHHGRHLSCGQQAGLALALGAALLLTTSREYFYPLWSGKQLAAAWASRRKGDLFIREEEGSSSP